VRLRYEQEFQIGVDAERSVALDLDKFAEAHDYWPNPKLSGRIDVTPLGQSDGTVTLEVAVVNTANFEPRVPHEPTWFDVRFRVAIDGEATVDLLCPLLRETRVRFQTSNCAVVVDSPRHVEVGPLGRVLRKRRTSREVRNGSKGAARAAVAEVQSGLRTADALDEEAEQAFEALRTDGLLSTALSRVHDAFVEARGSWSWRWHQLGFIAMGIRQFRRFPNELRPLVLNVPTAGGKTEGFVGLALLIAALEGGRSPVAIVKYPTKMLSREQLTRIARYLMCFEEGLPEADLRGLGYFADRDRSPADEPPTTTVMPTCPRCGANWALETKSPGGRLLRCPVGHRLRLAIRDEIFPAAGQKPPLLIVSTWDKFISKHDKGNFAGLFGRGSFISLVVYDEAHLIREETGSLDSHFETAFFEAMKQGGGRYPLTVLASATLAGIANHASHLGLGEPVEYPSRRAVAAHYLDSDDIQHIVLAAVPRGRTLLWALPMAFGEYLRVVEADAVRDFLKVPLLYFPSYNTLFRAQETIEKEVGRQRRDEGLAEPRLETFSRKRFELEGEGPVRERVLRREVDGVFSTNIASVGIDLPELSGILFYGVPTNVSEFIQALNRVGRASPAIALLLLDPFKERDASYFAFLPQFIQDPDGIIEWVPINRFARNAIQLTFDSIASNQLRLVFGPQFGGENLGMAAKFRAVHPTRLPDPRIIQQLKRAYRADADPSGAYAQIVEDRWTSLSANLTANRGRQLEGYISNTPGVQVMRNLRMPGPSGVIGLDAAAEALRRSGIRAVPDYQRAESAADTVPARLEETDAEPE
jgi:hypothetical protein